MFPQIYHFGGTEIYFKYRGKVLKLNETEYAIVGDSFPEVDEKTSINNLCNFVLEIANQNTEIHYNRTPLTEFFTIVCGGLLLSIVCLKNKKIILFDFYFHTKSIAHFDCSDGKIQFEIAGLSINRETEELPPRTIQKLFSLWDVVKRWYISTIV